MWSLKYSSQNNTNSARKKKKKKKRHARTSPKPTEKPQSGVQNQFLMHGHCVGGANLYLPRDIENEGLQSDPRLAAHERHNILKDAVDAVTRGVSFSV